MNTTRIYAGMIKTAAIWACLIILSACGKTGIRHPVSDQSLAEQSDNFPMEIVYERFEKNSVYLKNKGIRNIEDRPMVTYQVYKITSKGGFIFKDPKLLTMYVDPADKQVKFFCKDEKENRKVVRLVNPTVDSFGLERALGVETRKDLPETGTFLINDDKKVYFQKVGGARIHNRNLEGFAIVKAVDMEEEPYLLSDILTLYVNPQTTEVEYFSQLCDPCNSNPQALSLETEFSIGLTKEIRLWRENHPGNQ